MVIKSFKQKNFKLSVIINMLLSAAVIFFIFNSDITVQAAESATLNGLDLHPLSKRQP